MMMRWTLVIWSSCCVLVLARTDFQDRGDKTSGVNGGTIFFDAVSGEWKRNAGSVEVIRRTPVRTLNSGGVVNKVLKRRKKFRRFPLPKIVDKPKSKERSDSIENNYDDRYDKLEARESIDSYSFEKLEPLKTKYKTSDSIRMRLKPSDDKKDVSSSLKLRSSRPHEKINDDRQDLIKKYNVKNTPEVQKHKIELSDKFRFKQKIKTQKSSKPKYKTSDYYQQEQIGAESREEKTFNYLRDREEEDVLQTSGYHNSISIQEPSHNSLNPAYDYTIGNLTYKFLFC